MTGELILAIDQGTSSTRAVAFDRDLRPVASSSISLETRHPHSGWAEQDPEAILESVVDTVAAVLDEVGGSSRIAAVGMDNQGETVVAWDRETGRPLAPAVLWQCRRSLPIVERLRSAGLEARIRARTGLPLDPYFSASKITWLLEEDANVRAAAERGALRVGTVDAWLTDRLGRGDPRTDVSTASRTQLLRLDDMTWDDELLGWFGVTRDTLPRLVRSTGDLGEIGHPRWGGALALRAMACDQQAALAGHAGFATGAMKVTLGTGAFILANVGEVALVSDDLETSVGWVLAEGQPTFVLQGGVFTAGTFLGWLRDALSMFSDEQELDALAGSVPDAAGVRVLPSLAGLGAPWWRPDARTVIAGASSATGRAHVARAALDGVAQLVVDVVESMSSLLPGPSSGLRVDGGLTSSAFLIQRLADLTGRPVDIASAPESTALGVAGLAGLGAGLTGIDAIAAANPVRARLEPTISAAARADDRASWRTFVLAATRM